MSAYALQIEELENLEAPGWGSFLAGVAVGIGVVAVGTAVGIAIT